MSFRKIKPLTNSFVQKTIHIGRRIPPVKSIEDVDKKLDFFSKEEANALKQSFNEIEVWDSSTWSEREILAPIVAVSYDKNNVPIITYPAFIPLCSEEESNFLEEDEAIAMLQEKMCMLGYSDDEIGKFIEKIINFCYEWNVEDTEILKNLNNVGYHPVFGVRIIDYGLLKDGIIYEEV